MFNIWREFERHTLINIKYANEKLNKYCNGTLIELTVHSLIYWFLRVWLNWCIKNVTAVNTFEWVWHQCKETEFHGKIFKYTSGSYPCAFVFSLKFTIIKDTLNSLRTVIKILMATIHVFITYQHGCCLLTFIR